MTQTLLKEIINYNPQTGLFTWKIDLSSRKREGRLSSNSLEKGYPKITIFTKTYFAHHLVFLYMKGTIPNEVDHVNHIRDDNRWCNLRSVSRKENTRNASMRKDNKSGVTGVTWHKATQKWAVQIGKEGRWLGVYSDIDEAIRVRQIAEASLGYHQNHGCPLQ